MYLKAVEWLEDAGKDALAGDIFRCGGRRRRRRGALPCRACMPLGAALPTSQHPVALPGLYPCRQAIAQLVKAEKWGDAAAMLLRFAVACDGMGARNSQCKAYLGAVVVWLAAGRATEAWNTYQAGRGRRRRCLFRRAANESSPHSAAQHHAAVMCPTAQGAAVTSAIVTLPVCLRLCCSPQDALGVDNFMSSDEAFAAESLFDAYRRWGCVAGVRCPATPPCCRQCPLTSLERPAKQAAFFPLGALRAAETPQWCRGR